MKIFIIIATIVLAVFSSTVLSSGACNPYSCYERDPCVDSRCERGYDGEWQKLRQVKLANNPLCQHCLTQGVTRQATDVDHIRPFNGKHDPLRLMYANLQSLCRACHNRKTAGINANVRTVALIIPPTIGAAMRRMTSEPVPLPSMIGSNPAVIAATVIMIGRTRMSAPFLTAAARSNRQRSRCSFFALSFSVASACFRYTSITTPISTATPASAMKPTPTATDM